MLKIARGEKNFAYFLYKYCTKGVKSLLPLISVPLVHILLLTKNCTDERYQCNFPTVDLLVREEANS